MTKRHTDVKPGWIIREFAKIRKQMREDRAAKNLQGATIGKGGITVKNGGFVKANYPTELGGAEAVRFGPSPGGQVEGADFDASIGAGFQLSLKDENDDYVFVALRQSVSDAYPAGTSTVFANSELVLLQTPGSEGTIQLTSGNLALQHVNGVNIAHSTTGAAANCFIDPSDSRIWRSTSSRRRKVDIEDAEIDPAAVLKMRGVTFRDKGQVEADPDTETRYVGFIAEELHDLGLTEFVAYDDEGQPDAISYDRLFVGAVVVMKDQQSTIEAQQQLLEDLAARVTALESAADEASADS